MSGREIEGGFYEFTMARVKQTARNHKKAEAPRENPQPRLQADPHLPPGGLGNPTVTDPMSFAGSFGS